MNAHVIRVPSDQECRRIIAEMGVMEHIVAHCLQVRRVALLLTDHLEDCGLNPELVCAAALLRDITKTRSFNTGEDHAETGARLLCDFGYPELGSIVGQHVRLERYFAGTSPTEAEIVNYADKRVLHDRIVSLNDRMGYILERYGSAPERERSILLLWEMTRNLEERLFVRLPFAPEDLSRLLADTQPGQIPSAGP